MQRLPFTFAEHGRQGERQLGGEQFLGEPVQGCLRAAVTGTLSGRAVMPEMVLDPVTSPGDQQRSAACAPTAARQAGVDLRDVGESAVGTYAEDEALSDRDATLHIAPLAQIRFPLRRRNRQTCVTISHAVGAASARVRHERQLSYPLCLLRAEPD